VLRAALFRGGAKYPRDGNFTKNMYIFQNFAFLFR
jgi:hypothetical protein